MKDLYTEDYKMLLIENKDNINNWKDGLCSQTERINNIKISILSKEIYRFNTIPIKISIAVFCGITKNPPIAKIT